MMPASRQMDRRQLVPWLLLVGVTGSCLLGLPLLTQSRWWLLALVPFALSGYSQFAVVHEAIHGNLHPNRARNRLLGRIGCVLFGSPLGFLRDAHLLHHKYNRELGHPDLYDPARESWAKARRRYLFDLFLGLYLKEFGVGILCLLPRRLWANDAAAAAGDLNARLLSGIARDGRIGPTRFDSACMLLTYATSFVLYGNRAGYLAAALIVRGLVVSFHDNAYHYRTAPESVLYARNLEMPRLLRVLNLNFNHHGVHHAAPGVPWFELPAELTRRGGRMDGSWWQTTWSQLSGPFPLPERQSASGELSVAAE